MTSRNLYFSLMKEDLKRRLWAAALVALAFFFTLPIGTALYAGQRAYSGQAADWIRNWLSIHNGLLAVLVFLSAAIFGVSGFSYLHSRQKVDFYHSLPVKRTKLFFVHYLSGIVFFGAAFLINLVLAIVVASVHRIGPGITLNTAVQLYGFYLLQYIFLYSFAVLAMLLTGNLILGLAGLAVFHLFGPLVDLTLSFYSYEFLETSFYETNWWSGYSSPFLVMISNVESYGGGGWLAGCAVTAVIAVIVSACSWFLYQKRDSEAAGRAMAFAYSEPIIKIPLVVTFTLAGGMFFWTLRSNLGWGIFGMACGLLLSHCIIEGIFHFDFKQLFAHKGQMLICAVIAGLIFCVFKYDLFGYDSYIPEKNQIKSASIQFTDVDDWVDYSIPVQDQYGSYWYDGGSSQYIDDHMKFTDYDLLLDLARQAVSFHVLDGSRSISGSQNEGQPQYSSRIILKYELNNGKTVKRRYEVPFSSMMELADTIYRHWDYKKGTYPLLSQTAQETVAVNYVDKYLVKYHLSDMMGSQREIKELLTAYQNEFTKLSLTTMTKEAPVAAIRFMTSQMQEADRNEYNEYHDNIIRMGYYPIYPSFKKTIALLDQYGIRSKTGNNSSLVREIKLYGNRDGQTAAITSPEEIEQLMAAAVRTELSRFNYFYRFGDGILMQARIGEGPGSYTQDYFVSREHLPDFLIL